MTRAELGALMGEFSWDFGSTFFIETSAGNFIWSNPEYNGTNVIRATPMTHAEWLKAGNIDFSRHKGHHVIDRTCHGFVYVDDAGKIVEE